MFALKSPNTSSNGSYDSSSGAGDSESGREVGGSEYAGPRTLVRKARRGKLPTRRDWEVSSEVKMEL